MMGVELSPQLGILQQHLLNLGYREPTGTIIPNYEFIASEKRIGRADLLAFADVRRWDISTSCIAVQQWPNGDGKLAALKKLSYIGAPIALFVLPDRVEVWPVRVNPETLHGPYETLAYGELARYFGQHTRELSPHSLLSAKRGVRQLSFLDVDPSLEAFARKATRETLVSQFETAYETAIESARRNINADFSHALIRVAIWVLAACILKDKLTDWEGSDVTDIIRLLRITERLFPGYFNFIWPNVELVGQQVVRTLYEGLHSGFSFRSLTNDMLAYFYEYTLVNEKLRRQSGIYYTPRALAERILQRLPVEDLRPEERTVLDGTCGSGNLLLAAYDRLSNLLPAKWVPTQRHNYLQGHIWGVDQDSFACKVAQLSLLLYDLPSSDSWQVKPGDVFQVNPQQLFGGMPHIIVGNPPFKELRSREGARGQIAADVLERYLEWLAPYGLLGVIVPLTFLHNSSARKVREQLLKTCDVLEVWHLPEGEFPGSGASTAVILARKLPSSRSRGVNLITRVEELQHPLAQKHLDQRPETRISYVVRQERWRCQPERWLVSSPFDHIWDKIEDRFPTISPDFCRIYNGVQPGKQARPTHFSSQDQGEGWKPVLYQNIDGETLEPFAIRWENQQNKYIRYPSDELQWPRTPEHFDQPVKLVMNATRNLRNPWRFYAAIDRDKLIVTENFHYVLPSGKATAEELAAVFNSMLANAWYSSRNYHRDITLKYLNGMPFPRFEGQQKQEIRQLVRRIVKLKRSIPGVSVEELRRDITKIDDIVFDAYGLAREERKQLRTWMTQFRRPGWEWQGIRLEPRASIPYEGRQWRLSGEIEVVDAEHQTVSLWTQGLGAAIEIPIPSTMPGWALRPHAAFLASIPWEQRHETNLSKVKWLNFWPLDFGYLSDEELFSALEESGGV
jgi:hypothetical protein